MSIKRLQKRVKSVKFLGQHILPQHTLKFHKISKDGSGKCDAYFTGQTNDIVFGVLFDFHSREKHQLDRSEELGWGYEQKEVEIINKKGETVTAYTYYALRINSLLKPYSWYKKHVIYGAKQAKLPPNYLEHINNYPEMEDNNKQRESLELSIY